jgi:salicylate synthase
VGFSPEIVVKVDRDGLVVTQPLAGTRRMVGDRRENERLRSELCDDSKEVYEHAISVKAASEELLSLCSPGSVTIGEYMTVKERGTVQHLASSLSGQLAEGRTQWDALMTLFPAVTASGVPKLAALHAIRRFEQGNRGLYGGSVLTVDEDGALDAALVLRTAFWQDGRAWLQAGAGIVGQSNPDRELEETCEKLRSVSNCIVRETTAAGGTQGKASSDG